MSKTAESDRPVDLSDFYLVPIAKYMMSFGGIEKMLDWAIVTLIEARHRKKAEIAIAQLINFTAKIQLLAALASLTTKRRKHLNAMTRLKDELFEINAFRNNIAHGAWDSFSARRRGKTRVTQLFAEKNKIHPRKLVPVTFAVTPAEIGRQARRNQWIANRIVVLTDQIWRDRDPSLAISPPVRIILGRSPPPMKRRGRTP